MSEKSNAVYLGDGVYMSDDGHQLWLHLVAHDAPPLVALDQDTFNALVLHGRERFMAMTDGGWSEVGKSDTDGGK